MLWFAMYRYEDADPLGNEGVGGGGGGEGMYNTLEADRRTSAATSGGLDTYSSLDRSNAGEGMYNMLEADRRTSATTSGGMDTYSSLDRSNSSAAESAGSTYSSLEPERRTSAATGHDHHGQDTCVLLIRAAAFGCPFDSICFYFCSLMLQLLLLQLTLLLSCCFLAAFCLLRWLLSS